jgi:GTP-binding protein Era
MSRRHKSDDRSRPTRATSPDGGRTIDETSGKTDSFSTPPPGFRSGLVALIGRPNVGKSTLVNKVLGQKVSIVSDKPQTTRHRVTAVLDGEDYQLIFLDMPGFQKPRDTLTKRMQSLVNTTLSEVDAILFVLPGDQRFGRGDAFIADALRSVGTPVVMAVNKADLLTDQQAGAQLEAARALAGPAEVHLVSALTGQGLDGVVAALSRLLPEGPRYFPPGVVTDQPEEVLVGEFIREQLLAVTEEEVPHSLAVEVLEMEPRDDRDIIYIRAAIYVERASQRPILLGVGGERLKVVGTNARREIEWLLGSQVFLELIVKVRKHWRADPRMLDRLGL